MGIGVSLFLIALGAVLTWAVKATISGLDLNVVGIILMVVGGLGLLLTLLFWSDSAPLRRRSVTDDGVIREREREVR
jgi:hypothetical protein